MQSFLLMKKNPFLWRIVNGLFFISIFILINFHLSFFNYLSFYVFIFAFSKLALNEISDIFNRKGLKIKKNISLFFISISILIHYLSSFNYTTSLNLYICIFYGFFIIIILIESSQNDFFSSIENILSHVFITFYLFLPTILALKIHQENPYELFFIVALCISNDTFAFFGGKYLGNYHPKILKASPNKTLEGCFFGILGSILSSIIISFFFSDLLFPNANIIYNYEFLIPISILLGLINIAADLLESLLKRSAQIKDSGEIPGLGGVLDVIDGILICLPIFYIIKHGVIYGCLFYC